jgi:thiamine pyrophosphate-dependent acetolactate synthase large subunit-like protein
MKRDDLALLVEKRLTTGQVVICGEGATTFAWQRTRSQAPTFFCNDPMGLSPGLALGFALAVPERDVVLLTGDGELLFNLSVLVTIAAANPGNLRMIVFHNRRYETGGGQPLPGAQKMRLAAIAEASGLAGPLAPEAGASAAEIAASLDDLLAGPAPRMLVVEVDAEPARYPAAGAGGMSGVEQRITFQRQLEQLPPSVWNTDVS